MTRPRVWINFVSPFDLLDLAFSTLCCNGNQGARWLNFFSALRATRAAIAAMLEGGGGAIVNVASVNAFFQPDAATIDYGAAKAALVNLTKTLSQEFGPKRIRVNAVS